MGDTRIDVAALTLGTNTPSARFRVRQFIPALRRHGILVSEYSPEATRFGKAAKAVRGAGLVRTAIPLQWLDILLGRGPGLAAARRADLTWISKQLVPGLPTLERLLPHPLVLDVDDAMWLARPFGQAAVKAAARVAECIIVGSRHLAEYYERFSSQVQVIPTSIDLDRFRPRASDKGEESFVVGWTGSRTTLPFLQELDRPLAAFFARTRSARLLVICDTRPKFDYVPAERIDFVRWNADIEASALHSADVGIMPLPDTPLARGKCSFKMLQYMATGLPVIVSPVGANGDILRSDDVGWAASCDDDWRDALAECSQAPTAAHQKGLRGRAVVERGFNLERSADKIAEIFRTLTESQPTRGPRS